MSGHCPAKLRLPPPRLALRGQSRSLCSQGLRGQGHQAPRLELSCDGEPARDSLRTGGEEARPGLGGESSGAQTRRASAGQSGKNCLWSLRVAGGAPPVFCSDKDVFGFPGPGVLLAGLTKGVRAGEEVGAKPPSATAAAGVAAAKPRKSDSAWVQCQVPDWPSRCGGERR